jgi:hypothetical protein
MFAFDPPFAGKLMAHLGAVDAGLAALKGEVRGAVKAVRSARRLLSRVGAPLPVLYSQGVQGALHEVGWPAWAPSVNVVLSRAEVLHFFLLLYMASTPPLPRHRFFEGPRPGGAPPLLGVGWVARLWAWGPLGSSFPAGSGLGMVGCHLFLGLPPPPSRETGGPTSGPHPMSRFDFPFAVSPGHPPSLSLSNAFTPSLPCRSRAGTRRGGAPSTRPPGPH